MNSRPIVSILMTAYNREQYIAEAIESVLAQTYRNFELIIVDDGSRDSTVQIAKAYEKKDQRIKVYINEVNSGDYPNRNKALGYSTGNYIMYVDSDDAIKPDALKYIIDSFQKYDNVQHSSIYYHKDIDSPYLCASREAIRNHIFGKKNVLSCGPGARVFKRDFILSLGSYPEKYGPANDMYFNLKSTAAAPILFLPCIYLFYREHPLQENKNKKGYITNNYLYFRDALNEIELPLAHGEKKMLIEKNKKRLLVNLFKYLTRSFDFKGTINMIRATKLSFSDIKDAVLS